jgi:hypothetical protein
MRRAQRDALRTGAGPRTRASAQGGGTPEGDNDETGPGWTPTRAWRRRERGPPHRPPRPGVPPRSIGTPAAAVRRRPQAVAEERALLAAYAWIWRFDDYLEDGRQIFYTLYSLEKAGDLGGVERFGGRSWYEEGARRLLEKERPGGGWGTYIDTSFALLFLTRATQPLEARAAPALYTGGEGKPARGGAKDLVYIDRVRGFLSAREVWHTPASSRDEITAHEGSSALSPTARDLARSSCPSGRKRIRSRLRGKRSRR